MASHEVCETGLSEAARNAVIAKLDAAATFLGADKPPKMVFPNGDGTWDVGCTLDGDPLRLRDVLSTFYLGIGLPQDGYG